MPTFFCPFHLFPSLTRYPLFLKLNQSGLVAAATAAAAAVEAAAAAATWLIQRPPLGHELFSTQQHFSLSHWCTQLEAIGAT